jgi:hypothetical protein
LDKYGIWNNWSQRDANYDEQRNNVTWAWDGFSTIDVNVMTSVLKQKYKEYKQVTMSVDAIKKYTMNNTYVYDETQASD